MSSAKKLFPNFQCPTASAPRKLSSRFPRVICWPPTMWIFGPNVKSRKIRKKWSLYAIKLFQWENGMRKSTIPRIKLLRKIQKIQGLTFSEYFSTNFQTLMSSFYGKNLKIRNSLSLYKICFFSNPIIYYLRMLFVPGKIVILLVSINPPPHQKNSFYFQDLVFGLSIG